jgi:hypothetical protein
VIVPPAPLVPPARVDLTELAEIAVPDVPVAGSLVVSVVVFLTTVEVIPEPQVLAEEVSLESPL